MKSDLTASEGKNVFPIKNEDMYEKRCPVDRRSPVERRILDMGPGYPDNQLRKNKADRRKGWEDRYGWERISKWSSAPIFSDLP